MYLTHIDIAAHHSETIDNLHRTAHAWLDAADDLLQLGSRFARNNLSSLLPQTALDSESITAWRMQALSSVEQGLDVCSQLHEELTDSVARQRKREEQLWLAAFQRGASMAPHTIAHLFARASHSLQSVEETVEHITDSHRESLKLARRQTSDILDAATGEASPRRTSAPQRKRAAPTAK